MPDERQELHGALCGIGRRNQATRFGDVDGTEANQESRRRPEAGGVSDESKPLLLFGDDSFIDQEAVQIAKDLSVKIGNLSLQSRIATLNRVRRVLHEVSPFQKEPVDCVEWIMHEIVTANDYNPNSVAPPEMKLLELSIDADGFTQPIVAFRKKDEYEVVDGFHRNRVGRESKSVRSRLNGYLPLAIINADREERTNRIAATIRHNRARGKHRVSAMSDIVVELKGRNWSNDRIGRELGMDPDEVLRLCQITGLAGLFQDAEFSKSWDIEGEITEEDAELLEDDESTFAEEILASRTVNTSDENRIFHRHEKWECAKAGFYNTTVAGMTNKECEEAYRDFLADTEKFKSALASVITEWKHSCEHYLTNISMNRIAWLGQAAACYATGIPSRFRGGFYMLTGEQQEEANETALSALNEWLNANGREPVTMEEALSHGRQSDIY